jgi:hypothetical protein
MAIAGPGAVAVPADNGAAATGPIMRGRITAPATGVRAAITVDNAARRAFSPPRAQCRPSWKTFQIFTQSIRLTKVRINLQKEHPKEAFVKAVFEMKTYFCLAFQPNAFIE